MRFGRKWCPAGRGDRKPAACDPQSAVRCEPAGKPEMAPERLEKIEIALGNGAPPAPPRRPMREPFVTQGLAPIAAMDRMLAGRLAPTGLHLGSCIF